MRFPDDEFDERRSPGRQYPDEPATDPNPLPSLPVVEQDFDQDPMGTGDMGGDDVPDFGSFEIPSYTGPWAPQMNFGPAPRFNAPRFDAPSYEQATNEPGFQFRLNSGTKALDASAAARGHLRTGGHFTNLLEYGQQFGAQEYANMYNRALQTFQANADQSWRAYEPQLQEWLFRSGASRDAGLAQYGQQFNLYQLAVQAALERERLAQNAAFQPPPVPPDASAY